MPFAAVHADPDCTRGWNTRFGPTAFALPKLERYHSMHIKDFLSALNIDKDVTSVYMDLFKDKTIRRYILRNVIEELPWLGKDVFVKDARKIIPTLEADDMLGEAKIVDTGVIFNMTPSPGASSSLSIAHQDALAVCKHLGAVFDEEKHAAELQSL